MWTARTMRTRRNIWRRVRIENRDQRSKVEVTIEKTWLLQKWRCLLKGLGYSKVEKSMERTRLLKSGDLH